MANIHLSNSRSPMPVTATGDSDPEVFSRGSIGSGGPRHFASVHPSTEYRTGENFLQLKLTAEKMMQEEACLRSELEIMRNKFVKSKEEVRNVESKLMEMNNEMVMVKVEHNEDVKLWKGLDSKFLATSTFSDHLAETLTLLESELKEAEQSKNSLEEKFVEREKFYEDTKSKVDDMSLQLKAAADSVKEYVATIAKLSDTLQQQTLKVAAEIAKSKKLSCDNDALLQQVSKAVTGLQQDKEMIESKTAEIQLLTKNLLSKAEDVANLQSKNLAIVQAKGELEFHLKDLQNSLNLSRKDNETLREKLEMLNLKVSELQKTNTVATCTIENLHSERVRRTKQAEEDKKEQQRMVNELKEKLSEFEDNAESNRQSLREKTQEIETLLNRVAESASEIETAKDEVIRVRQECCEKQQLIEQMSREIQELRGKWTAAENTAQELSVRFKHQVEAKQAELTVHLQEISLRNNQEMADMRRRSEEQTREAAAEEKRKVRQNESSQMELNREAALEAIRQSSKQELSRELDAANQRLSSAQMHHEHKVSLMKHASEEVKEKMSALHAEELRNMQLELRSEMEKRCEDVTQTLHHQNEEMKKFQQEEMTKLQARHDILLKTAQEVDSLRENLKKLKEDRKVDQATSLQELNTKYDLLSREHESSILSLESTFTREIEEWKSKATFWQIEFIKLRNARTQVTMVEKEGAHTLSTTSNNAECIFTTDYEASPAKDNETLQPTNKSSNLPGVIEDSQTTSDEHQEPLLPATIPSLPRNHGLKRELAGSSRDEDLKLSRKLLTAKSFVPREHELKRADASENSENNEKFDGNLQMQRVREQRQKVSESTIITRKLSAKNEEVVNLGNSEGRKVIRTIMVADFPIIRTDSEANRAITTRRRTGSRVSSEDCEKIKPCLHTSLEKSRTKPKRVKFNEKQQLESISKTLSDLFEMEELMDPYSFNERNF